MSSSRSEERDKLLTKLGYLFDPARRLLSVPDFKTKTPFVESQFNKELREFLHDLNGFCSSGGISQTQELVNAHNAVCQFRGFFGLLRAHDDPTDMNGWFDDISSKAAVAIRALPCQDVGQILPASSPFSTYTRLLALCRSAATRLHIFDPFIDKPIYDLYLGDVDRAVTIVVVTDEDNMKNIVRRDRIVAVSELFAIQRPTTYELRVAKSLHDRHIRIDGQILHVGGSPKDASKFDPYTISHLPSSINDAVLDAELAAATEWVGETIPAGSHRRAV